MDNHQPGTHKLTIPCRSLCLVFLVSWLLLLLDLQGKSLWTDELFTAAWARLPLPDTIAASATDYHPPLYFLLVALWGRIAGYSDFALRWPSVAAAWLGSAVLYQLGKSWKGQKTGFLGTILWGSAPVVILYGRMARYYSLTALFGLLSTLALWRALTRGKKRHWIAYIVASSAALYTFYLSALLLAAQGGLVLSIKDRRKLSTWFASGMLIMLSLTPWIPTVLEQAVRTGQGAADLSYSIVGIILKIGYPAYALLLGESLFPWHPLALIGGLAAVFLLAEGTLSWYRTARQYLLPLLGLVLLPLGGLVAVTTWISPRTPFVSMPARALFALPYAFLLWNSVPFFPRKDNLLRSRAAWQHMLPTFLVATAWALSLFNYYTDQQFLNPIYLTPAREIAVQVVEGLEPGDVIYSPFDSGFYYYYEGLSSPAPHFMDQAQLLAYLQTHPQARVWVLTLGRDQTRDDAPTELQERLQSSYQHVRTWTYVAQDPIYRAIKSRLLHRPAYAFRAELSLYMPIHTHTFQETKKLPGR